MRRECCVNKTIVTLAALACAIGASVARADRFEEQVGVQLLAGAVALTNRGYKLSHEVTVRKLPTGGMHTITMQLDEGSSYAITAVCDEDCVDIDLFLYDDNGNQIDKDTQRDDLPVVTVSPKWTATFRLHVLIPACNASRCTFGVGVFSK